ncbi:MAG: LysM peptidoglycan-binding domain-containing protein [Anaerolineae bacterium]|nr:LysM peptidoglycan-binding domain-containing protein [Anaerolineae bacterium]
MQGRSNDGFWAQVRLASGKIGWVYGAYLKGNAPVASLPIIADTNPDPADWKPTASYTNDGQGGLYDYGVGGPDTYMVQTGDTLFSIALRFGVDPGVLAARNGISNPNYIQIGQVLYIP